ncbi:MAG: GntR family transcriptional regulator [Actinomycetota bacterium]|nr:GntR family transcriptional regulator [Actinomycetota bacterium]
MELTVDPGDPTPPYEQLRRQLVDLIVAGRLPIGERLPPVRQLAGDLALATGTVARAYRELEQAGLVHTRRGAGTRVAAVPADASDPIDVLAGEFVRRARSLGYSTRQIAEAVGQAAEERSS